jgi:expansin
MARSVGPLALVGIALATGSCTEGGSNHDGSSSGGTTSGQGGNPAVGGGGPSSGGDGSAHQAVPFGDEHSGVATYYAANGEGACMFDASPQDMNVTAINAVEWSNSAWCGACIDVTGPSGSVRVRVVDLCPECKAGHLDLSREAFAQIAAVELGRVDITWQMVPCDVSGPVSYRYKDGANQWWTAVQVLNHRLPIESMEYSKDGGGAWESTQRMDYNYFLADGGFGEGSTQVRITAIDGQTLVDELPAVQEYLVTEGSAQFQ